MERRTSAINYIICCPIQGCGKSNGIDAMVELGKVLELAGNNVHFVMVWSEYPRDELLLADRCIAESSVPASLSRRNAELAKNLGIKLLFRVDGLLREEGTIVIYSERIIDNPLRANRVVRYFGNKDGALNGGKLVNRGDMDFILAHSRAHVPDAHAHIFYASVRPEFRSRWLTEPRSRILSATYFGKLEGLKNVELMPHTVLISRTEPASKEALSNLLNQVRFLFTWDAMTHLIAEGIFCGAAPVLLGLDSEMRRDLEALECAPVPFLTPTDIWYNQESCAYECVPSPFTEQFQAHAQRFIANFHSLQEGFKPSVLDFHAKALAHFGLEKYKTV